MGNAAAATIRHWTTDAGGLPVHTVEAGSAEAPAIVLLHGWPQSATAYEDLMAPLSAAAYVVALDLPGIGGSPAPAESNDKRTLARTVRATIRALGLRDVTLVGHDVGGMIAYAYLKAYPHELRGAAILNVAIPGIDPWPEVVRNPHLWHFAFHAVPKLPETLVSGREAAYFAFFYDAISATPGAIGQQHRAAYAQAYARPAALKTGFDWYRAFPQDEKDNQASRNVPVDTQVLYLRGDHDQGATSEAYVAGLRASEFKRLEARTIPNCGHFSPEEQPGAVAAMLTEFIALNAAR